MKNVIKIGDRLVGRSEAPFIIAEMSGNHNQSLDRALKMVDAAADAGVSALKLQTFTADTITMDVGGSNFEIEDFDSLWANRRLYDLYAEAHTPWDWHKAIMDRAADRGIICFSSPFDETAVDFLDDLGAPAFKIASFENNHIPLIRYAASKGKPLIISTGMASLAELQEAVEAAFAGGCTDLILLKCTSTYPATPTNTNLATIPHLCDLFGVQVGLSDHTMGVGTAVAAVTLGATVVEKHFTLSRADGGVDSAFSLEPAELAALVEETHRAWQSIGSVYYGPTKAEEPSLAYRRSLFFSEHIEAGDAVTSKNIKCIRPADGLAPRHYDEILGRTVTKNCAAGTPVSWDLLSVAPEAAD